MSVGGHEARVTQADCMPAGHATSAPQPAAVGLGGGLGGAVTTTGVGTTPPPHWPGMAALQLTELADSVQ